MLKSVSDLAVPVLVFLLMVVVGLGLTTEDFRRVVRRPWLVAAATIGQFILLPAIALILAQPLSLNPPVAKGVLLVAACPAGSMANFYTYLARANVALSVSLTAVSCLTAVLTMPILLMSFQAYLGDPATFAVPVLVLLRHLLLTLMAPVLTGAFRRLWLAVSERRERGLFGLSLAALAVLIGFVIAHEAEHFGWPCWRGIRPAGCVGPTQQIASRWG